MNQTEIVPRRAAIPTSAGKFIAEPAIATLACVTISLLFQNQVSRIMADPNTPRPVSLTALIIGLVIALCCAIWGGFQFLNSGHSLGYGVIAGISIGAAYAFLNQIRIRRAEK